MNLAHFQENNWNYILRSKESYVIKYEIPDNDEFDIETNLPANEFPADFERII